MIGAAIATFATIATAAAYGWWGVLALAGVALIAVAAEFWRELSRAERANDGLIADEAAARVALTEARAQRELMEGHHADALEEAREEYRKLRTEAIRLERQNAELGSAAEASHVGLRKLLSATEEQVRAIEQTEKNRVTVGRLGTHEWPAVSISRRGTTLEVVAHVESGAAELEGETVCLFSKMLGGVIGKSAAHSHGDRQVMAQFQPDDISRFARRRFQSRRDLEPDPFTLRLDGFDEASPLATFSDSDLQSLKTALRGLQTAIASMLIPRVREDSN